MSRRILQVLVSLSAVQALIGGALPTDPAWARVDFMVPSIERHSAWFRLACLGIFGMGVGRYLSSLAFPPTPGNSTGAMIAELVIPPIYVPWQHRVARSCGDTSSPRCS